MRLSVFRLRSAAMLAALSVLAPGCGGVRVPEEVGAIRASGDPEIIARGRYLAEGPAHCRDCHGDPSRPAGESGPAPMSGGRVFDLGILGTVVAPNISTDPEAGIGGLSDADIVRSLRYGISHDGRPLVPIMPFAEMADRDLEAIVSYLRTLPADPTPAPANDLSWIGRLALRLLEPAQQAARPAAVVEPERSAEYGRYLAHTVANCHGCHTRRSKWTGAYVGPPFAGGMELTEGGATFVSPNLTRAEDGLLRRMSEREFIERFRSRDRTPGGSPMPWQAYARMTDADLAAIYRYLQTVPPAETPG